MSASLVGSEMCIRDSPTSARTNGAEHHSWGAVRVNFDAVPGPVQIKLRTVSYTHLTLPTICSV
eukprot:13349533-Alexandrium_andersonii.AAC.1